MISGGRQGWRPPVGKLQGFGISGLVPRGGTRGHAVAGVVWLCEEGESVASVDAREEEAARCRWLRLGFLVVWEKSQLGVEDPDRLLK